MADGGTRQQEVAAFRQDFVKLRDEVAKVIVGNQEIVEGALAALCCRGHVLLEGVPGLGKTLLVKCLSQTLGFEFKRIQFTPDLMPADILGTQLVTEREGRKAFEFSPGPLFANIILADEINRATPKTQSALLEAMEERQVTVAGTTHRMQEPFFVLATENPIEMEGTYPLPEAQVDRFLFKLTVPYPTAEEMKEILRRTTAGELVVTRPVFPPHEAKARVEAMRVLVREVLVSRVIEDYAVRIVLATHPDGRRGAREDAGNAPPAPAGARELATRYVSYGASPRGAQALILGAKVKALLDGRVNVSVEDIDAIRVWALNHRVIMNFEAEADKLSALRFLEQLEPLVGKP